MDKKREEIKDQSWISFNKETILFESSPWLNSNTIDWYTQVRNVLASNGTTPQNNMLYQNNSNVRWLWITLNYNNTEKAFEILKRLSSLQNTTKYVFSIWDDWTLYFGDPVVWARIINWEVIGQEWIIIWDTGERVSFFGNIPVTQQTTPINYPTTWWTLSDTQACLDDLISKLQTLWLIA